MNSKEVAEIKKHLKHEHCVVNRLRLCYVNSEKEIVANINTPFLMLDEEEQFKYCDILKKSLSGKLNKTLLALEFPRSEEEVGGKQERLYSMVKEHIQNDDSVSDFYDEIIANYNHAGNYLIIMAYGDYDIPCLSTDGASLEDSDYVYSFILCCICPVELSKPGLCYSGPDNNFIDKVRDWMVQPPQTAFLFPAFTDRQTDLHNVMYFSKKESEQHEEFAENVFGCTLPMKAQDQKEIFAEVLEEALGEEATLDNLVAINKQLVEYAEVKKEENEKTAIDGNDVNRLLGQSGIDKSIEGSDADFEVMADNISDQKYVFEWPGGIKLQVNEDCIDLVTQQNVDGVPYIMIPVSNATMNGIHIRADVKGKK